MNYETDIPRIIVNIGNRSNKLITTVEQNLNSCFNELMNFYESFATRIVK